MALLFVDSFDHYATADLTQKYTLVDTASFSGTSMSIASASGRRAGGALKLATTNTGSASPSTGYVQCAPANRGPAPSGTTFVIGFAFKSVTPFSGFDTGTDDTPAANGLACICAVIANGWAQVWFRLNNDGTISAYRSPNAGGAGTLLGTTSWALTQSVFEYLEFKVVLSDAAGTVDIKKDGTSGLSLSAIDTKGSTSALTDWSAFRLGPFGQLNSTPQIETYFDDLYVLDGSGAVRTTFLGDCRVDAVYPTAEGATINGTPSTGTDNALLVDETAPNTTDYNTLASVNDKDTFVMQDTPVVNASVYGVQVNASVKKVDAGNASLVGVVRHSAADYDTAASVVAADYAYTRGIFEQNPGTSTNWVTSDIDAAEFGYKKSV